MLVHRHKQSCALNIFRMGSKVIVLMAPSLLQPLYFEAHCTDNAEGQTDAGHDLENIKAYDKTY